MPKVKGDQSNQKNRKNKKKVLKKNNDIVQLEKELVEIKDKHLRLKAEFENFRRRKAEEISKLLQFDGENVISGFLTIIDDLERMIQSAESSQESSQKSLKEGIKLVESKIYKYFDSLNIESFGQQGDDMDPEIHNAMLTQTDKEFEDNVILEVYEKGYTYREKVIRHAKVIVNKK